MLGTEKRYSFFPYMVVVVIVLIALWGLTFHANGSTMGGSQDNEPFVTPVMAGGIADTHASQVWGADIARGNPFMLHKEDGTPFAYVFPYALHSQECLSHQQIFDAVNYTHTQYEVHDKRFHTALEEDIGSFGCVEVSISRSNFPVLAVRHSLHPYFLYSEKAAEIARERLKALHVELVNVEFNGPHELYFNFKSDEGRIKLHAFLMKTKEELNPLPMPDEAEEESPASGLEIIESRKKKAWEEFDNNSIHNTLQSSKWINHYTLVPVVNWTHWCVPTAMTMTAGYWDHYDPRQGTWPNWGSIFDYWFDHGPLCQNNNVTNVPNFIDELITHKTCSWAPGGLLGVLNSKNGYNFSFTDTKGTAQNDWNWPLIVSEVNKDRPVVWGVGPQKGHAMTAFGYRQSGSQKFVVVYNTWGATAAQQLAEYNYDQWAGAPNTKTGVGVLLPGGGTNGNHAILTSLRGGQTVMGEAKITWFVWGPEIKWTVISFSNDGGTSWSTVHKESLLPTKPGWNNYNANLNTKTSKGRIRINCFAGNLKHIAGDGSVSNFFVQGKADLVPISACKKNSSGQLVVSVKNQGTVKAPASTTRVEFVPGGIFDLKFPEVGAGATVEAPLSIHGTCWNPDCDYTIKADIHNQVNEANEGNNTASGVCPG